MWRLLPLLLIGLAALPGRAVAPPGCVALARHVPAADVAYQPGVDARGRPVAPPDLAPAPMLQGERVLIDLALPVFLFRRGPERRIDNADVVVGHIEVDLTTGAVFLNGEPLTPPETAVLAAWCRRQAGEPPLPAYKPAPK